jgi:hypothetical protein
VHLFFSLAFAVVEAKLGDEELSQDSPFGSGGCDLHRGFRRRQAELREDG